MPRQAGILMPITSLPSPYGIGTIGKEAYKCSCGHHFREYEWVAEFTKPDGSIERYIRNEYGMNYELVKDGVTHPAEWVLTPIKKEDEPQNGGDVDG